MRRRTLIAFGISAVMIIVALVMVFIVCPTEATMGNIQRIFYFHVPVAWNAFFSFFVTFVFGIVYLKTRNPKYDFIAESSAKIGLVFATLILLTGMIWAKPIWGVWWTWDARLTSSLVMWLIYLAYFIIRSYISEEEKKYRFGSIIGIVGFIDIPIVALSIQLAPTTHPKAMIFNDGLHGTMLLTLLLSIAAMFAVYFLFMFLYYDLRTDEYEIARMKKRLLKEND